MQTLKMKVEDMQCTGCASRVVNALTGVRGVVKVITSVDEQMAEVTFDERSVSPDELTAALKGAGFLQGAGKCP